MYEANRGVCFFAYNNEQLDYVKFSLIAARFVKKYLNLPVCLITDEGSDAWLHESHSQDEIDSAIDYIVITNDDMKQNMRRHYDSPWAEFTAQFSNSNKHKVYEYSPFEKTLLLDIDYFVRSNTLLKYFNTTGVQLFDNALDLRNNLPALPEQFLYDAGIKMCWSTVIYFDRSETSKLFFDTWAHIAENYSYYQYLYNFPSKLFRTDYCVSIAVHILNGMNSGDTIGNFDNTSMVNMSQKDDIVNIIDLDTWNFIAHDSVEPWKNILVRSSKCDVHVMNKRSLDRQIDTWKEMLDD